MKIARFQGFSLIEVTLAVLLIVLVLLPLLSVFSASHQNTRVTMEEVISVNFASEIMEALQALPFDQLRLMNSAVTFDNGVFTPDPFASAVAMGNQPGLSARPLPQGFETHILVDSYPDSGKLVSETKLLRLLITVKWGARKREIKLMTLKGRY